MKFGKTLARSKRQVWGEFYINYKALKQAINRLSVCSTVYGSSTDFKDAEEEFLDLVFREAVKINRHYLSIVDRCTHHYEIRVNHVSGLTLSIAADFPTLQMISNELDQLRAYVFLNHLGFRKILKKFDKKMSVSLKNRVMKVVMQQDFYMSRSMANLLVQCNCMLADVKGNPSSMDFLCPICLSIPTRPVLLTCAHSFCYDCLSRASDHCGSCPVCRKEQSLDPKQYGVSVILDQFLKRHFSSESDIKAIDFGAPPDLTMSLDMPAFFKPDPFASKTDWNLESPCLAMSGDLSPMDVSSFIGNSEFDDISMYFSTEPISSPSLSLMADDLDFSSQSDSVNNFQSSAIETEDLVRAMRHEANELKCLQNIANFPNPQLKPCQPSGSTSPPALESVGVDQGVNENCEARRDQPEVILPRKCRKTCTSCYKSKVGCDGQRPCSRCVRLRKDICEDRPQRKRGRPRKTSTLQSKRKVRKANARSVRIKTDDPESTQRTHLNHALGDSDAQVASVSPVGHGSGADVSIVMAWPVLSSNLSQESYRAEVEAKLKEQRASLKKIHELYLKQHKQIQLSLIQLEDNGSHVSMDVDSSEYTQCHLQLPRLTVKKSDVCC
eukprot:290273_1